MPRLTRVVLVMASVGLAALIASPVSAHAFGQRYDLPIPLNYFLIGAVAAVALSFVVLGMFVQRSAGQVNYPRLNLLHVPAVGPILSSRIASTILRVLSVAIFVLLVVAGFFGTARPIENISPHLHLDHLVGRNGIRRRAARQCVDGGQSLENNFRVVPEADRVS